VVQASRMHIRLAKQDPAVALPPPVPVGEVPQGEREALPLPHYPPTSLTPDS